MKLTQAYNLKIGDRVYRYASSENNHDRDWKVGEVVSTHGRKCIIIQWADGTQTFHHPASMSDIELRR